MSGYALHPEAFADLDDIRFYIARNNPNAANWVMMEIFDAFQALVYFPHRRPQTSPASTTGLYR
jgi:plasmid stabilization system protein ParE